jgi:pyrroloquinoline-quinone synthase
MHSTAQPIMEHIEAKIAARHLLQHPFYQAWSRGELTLDALRDYAAQYYQHVAAFPTYLSAVHAQTEDQAVRKHLLTNLMDEEAGSPNHPELWMQFAERLGLSREQVESSKAWNSTRSLIDGFRSACSNHGTAAGVAALYAYESQIPAVSEKKIEGLRDFYGFKTEDGYRYFTVHIEADREHSATERALLGQLLQSADEAACNQTVDTVLDGLYGLLSEVCERHGIAAC